MRSESSLQTLAVAAGHLGKKLLSLMVDELNRTEWRRQTQADKDHAIERMRNGLDQEIGVSVRHIAQTGFPFIVADIESVAIKDGAKCTLAVGRGTEAFHMLCDRVGARGILVFADSKEFVDGMEDIRAEADQPDLFDLGTGEITDRNPEAEDAAQATGAGPGEETPPVQEPAPQPEQQPEPVPEPAPEMTREQAMELLATADEVTPEVRAAIAKANAPVAETAATDDESLF